MEERVRDLETGLSELTRDVAVLKRDVSGVQSWEAESRRFHRTVSTFMDTFNATQARIEKEQSTRHIENQDAIDKLGSRIGFGMLLIALAALIVISVGVLIAYQAGKSHARLFPVSRDETRQIVEYNATE